LPNALNKFTHTHTHTHTIRVHAQKKKKPNFQIIPRGLSGGMVDLFSCESPSLEMNFCYPSLNLSCGYFPEKAQTPLIPGGVSHTFTLLPEPERHGFTPNRVIRGSLGGDQSPLLPPKAGLNLNLGSYQSDGRCIPPLTGSCALPGSTVHPRPSPQLAGLTNPSLGSNCPLVPDGNTSPGGPGDAPWQQGR
jgi:hypothetical protein